MPACEELFLLKGIGQNEREEIISRFPAAAKFKKGELIYSSDSYLKAIAFVVSGEVCADADNKNHVFMRRFTPGMCFGAAAVFGGAETYVSTVYAAADSEIIFITEDLLTEIFSEYPGAAINYITFLTDKIRFLNSRLSVISCSSAEDTVLKYLTAAAKDGYAVIPKMTLLSKALGLGRASLYRSLDALEEQGSIKREKNRIKVIMSEEYSD